MSAVEKKKTFNELIIMQSENSHWESTPIIPKLITFKTGKN